MIPSRYPTEHILNQMPAKVAIFSGNMENIRWCNTSFLSGSGYTEDEINELKNDFLKLIIHPDDYKFIERGALQINERSENMFPFSVRVKSRHDTQWHWEIGNLSPFSYKNSVVVNEIIGIFLDLHLLPASFSIKNNIYQHILELNSQPVLKLLSDREIDVLRALAIGKSHREIAHELNISYQTVEVHLKNIRKKLGIHHSALLIMIARLLEME